MLEIEESSYPNDPTLPFVLVTAYPMPDTATMGKIKELVHLRGQQLKEAARKVND